MPFKHAKKLGKMRCESDVRKHFFTHRVVGHLNAPDQHTVDALSINAFKGREIKQTEANNGGLLWITPLSPWTHRTFGSLSPVRLHKVRHVPLSVEQ